MVATNHLLTPVQGDPIPSSGSIGIAQTYRQGKQHIQISTTVSFAFPLCKFFFTWNFCGFVQWSPISLPLNSITGLNLNIITQWVVKYSFS